MKTGLSFAYKKDVLISQNNAMKQIVIVDDQSTTRYILTQVMQQIELPQEVNIKAFEDPMDALDWIEQNDTHLIMVDYRMNKMNGQEFLKKVKNIKKLEKTHVIGMSVDDDISLRYQFLEDGATDFFLKPFDYQECILRCRNLLS